MCCAWSSDEPRSLVRFSEPDGCRFDCGEEGERGEKKAFFMARGEGARGRSYVYCVICQTSTMTPPSKPG